MEKVVCGPGRDRSRGLVSCEICACPNSHDHNRQAKRVRDGARGQTVRLQRWDFLLLRDDGSGIRLHPEWSSTKFRVYELDPRSDPVPPPGKGLGKSDGPGTFARYKGVGVQTQGRFDASKGSHLPPRWRTPKYFRALAGGAGWKPQLRRFLIRWRWFVMHARPQLRRSHERGDE